MPDPRNDDLLKRLQQGDEQALSDLADAYGAKIYQLAFRYLRNHEDAEEVTQDVLYKVFRKVPEFRGDAALSSWIYRITFNSAMSRLRSASYQRTQDEQRTLASPDGEDTVVASLHEIADWSNMADEHLLRSQLRRRPSADRERQNANPGHPRRPRHRLLPRFPEPHGSAQEL